MNECQKIPTSPSVLPGLILLKFKCLNVVFDYEFVYLIKAKLLLCDLKYRFDLFGANLSKRKQICP